MSVDLNSGIRIHYFGFLQHGDWGVNRLVHFPSPHFKLISAESGNIYILDTRTYLTVSKLEGIHNNHSVTDLVKYDETNFLSCSEIGRTVKMTSVIPHHGHFESIDFVADNERTHLGNIMKINNDRFLVSTAGRQPLFYIFSRICRSNILRVEIKTIDPINKLLKSKIHPNCLYTMNDQKVVNLNFYEGTVVKKYFTSIKKNESGMSQVTSLLFTTLSEDEKQEIIVSKTESTIYFHDSQTGIILREIFLGQRINNTDISDSNTSTSLKINDFLVLSQERNVILFDLVNQKKLSESLNFIEKENSINSMVLINQNVLDDDGDDDEMTIAISCRDEGKIRILKISGLEDLTEKHVLQEKDLRGRVSFINDDFFSFCSIDCFSSHWFRIRIIQNDDLLICRSFMYTQKYCDKISV